FASVGLAWGFISGLTVTFIGLTSRIQATFPHAVTDPIAGMRDIIAGVSHYQRLVVGALLGTAAVWIDKVVFWFSAEGSQLTNGLLHAPLYDSSMFIASLALVPPLASFVMTLETGFFDRYQQYFATIGNHGTLDQIDGARQRLATYTLESLTLITVTLAGIAAILILTAPIVIDALGLQFRQIAILRYGALGAVFHFVLIAASAVLLFFDRRRRYMLLQGLFLVLNGGLAALSIQLGEDYYGTGYFLACLISAAVAYRMADDTLERLNFLTFLGNNPSIVGAKGPRFVWLDWILAPFRSTRRTRG
ncbi:MAG: exopolysaccharide Pel transporter PelG, partial [Hyphomicrobiaceae bacterium]|nr:exopolysaccharide Pel transporter PelG [Hyphomicrobiaceae bacterium]